MLENVLFGTGKIGKVFYDKSLPAALESAKEHAGEDGVVAAMPDIATARILASGKDYVWQKWFTTTTGEYKGLSKGGNPVYIVAHGVGPLTEPGRIRRALEGEKGLIRGAVRLSPEELYALLERDGDGQVIVLDFAEVKKTETKAILVDSAYDNLLVRARLGKQTEAYLRKNKEIFGDRIGNLHDCDKLKIEVPQGRLLYFGHSRYHGLLGYDYLYVDGRFIGINPTAA